MAERRGRGRPSKIDQAVDKGPTLLTVADRIVTDLRRGAYFEHACAAADVHKQTGYGWLQVGAATRKRKAAGEAFRPTAHEARCVAFSYAVDQASAAWFADVAARLESAATGGRENVTITERSIVTEGGEELVVERVRKTERLAPRPEVDQWRLERRAPHLFGKRTAVEHSGPGGGPVQVQVQQAKLSGVLAGVLTDLGLDPSDPEVRAVVAARLRSMSADTRHEAIETTSSAPG